MSAENIINITEANLHQTLEQSMAKPVLFYFWSARSQHCEQLTPILDKLANLLIGLILFLLLHFETRRYKVWRGGRP